MSYSNRIKSLLDIQDPNIIFEEDCVKEGTFKEKRCKYILGKLTYNPTHCGRFGVKNIDYTVYKNGTQLSRITLPITGVNPTYLLLKGDFSCLEWKMATPWGLSVTGETPQEHDFRDEEERKIELYLSALIPNAPRKASIWNGKKRGYIG